MSACSGFELGCLGLELGLGGLILPLGLHRDGGLHGGVYGHAVHRCLHGDAHLGSGIGSERAAGVKATFGVAALPAAGGLSVADAGV
jgi:hypothetical protein